MGTLGTDPAKGKLISSDWFGGCHGQLSGAEGILIDDSCTFIRSTAATTEFLGLQLATSRTMVIRAGSGI